MPPRTTTVVPDRLAAHRARLAVARGGALGHHVTTLPGLAGRLAGGFLHAATTVEVERALQPPPELPGTGLAEIAKLPGFSRAAARTLQGVWARGLDLAGQASAPGAHPRWRELHTLELAALAGLPPGALSPADLVGAALERVAQAAVVLGPVTLERVVDVEPVYRPLIAALAEVVPVVWRRTAAPLPSAHDWLGASQVELRAPETASPRTEHVSYADPEHEVRAALRWARRHLSEGRAPADIAIAAASPSTYDELLHALAREAALPLHAAAGWSAVTTPAGQHAAALAELVVRGLDRERVARFVRTGRALGSANLAALPSDWYRALPERAPLDTLQRWRDALATADPAWQATAALLLALVGDVHEVRQGAGPAAAAAALGERWLTGAARGVWARALAAGPAAAIDLSLAAMRVADGVDPAAAIVWAPAATLVGSPRPVTRLLGLAARSWPRRNATDPLLPDHVLGPLAPLRPYRAARDRADFAALVSATVDELVLSRPRRGLDGHAQAASPLLRDAPPAQHAYPRDPVEHAFSETDRRQARPLEFASLPHARAALGAWRALQQPELTAHDGLVRSEHPALAPAIGRLHSASSLRRLLRDPLAFVAQYALAWHEDDLDDTPLALDPLDRGSLLHDILQRTVTALEAAGGLAVSAPGARERALDAALEVEGARWPLKQRVPPPVLWRATLAEVRRQCLTALNAPFEPFPGGRSFVEVPFGGRDDARAASAAPVAPWDVDAPVTIPGTAVAVSGYVDRIDLSHDARVARVIDYKSGRDRPGDDLAGGKELQRAIYTSAVKALLGADVAVEAYLLHTRSGARVALQEPERALAMLATALRAALASLSSGSAIPGPDSFDGFGDLRLALPADLDLYRRRKDAAIASARSAIDAAFEVEA